MKLVMALSLVLLTLLLDVAPVFAQGTTVDTITIDGLKRTKRFVVIRELGFDEGDQVDELMIQEAQIRLRNTGLFSEASVEREGSTVKVVAKDRWTTIPIAKFSSGGGANQLILGVYDPNVLGRYIESGAQYERLGETNSGVLWFKNPRLFDQRLILNLEAWSTNRLRKKYFQDQIDPTLLTGFLHTRLKLHASLMYEFNPLFKLGLGFEHHQDEFSDRYLDDETKEASLASGKGLPPDTMTNFVSLQTVFGRIKRRSYLFDGIEGQWHYSRAEQIGEDLGHFYVSDFKVLAGLTLFDSVTLAQRLMFGGTNTKILQYWFYLGGLDRVRGFADNRFAGRYYWLSNSEARVPVYRSPKLVVQGVAFHDVVGRGEEIEELDRAAGASVGGGLRIIAPTVYRLVARLDFAVPIVKRDEIPISFGVQQFF